MRDFERRGAGRLRALPFHARLVYSIFLIFTLAAFGLTVWLLHEMVGLDLSGAGEYYAGEPAEPAEAAEPAGTPPTGPAADGGGPLIELPQEAAEVGSFDPMPRRKLLEVTHFHLFSMPVYLLILSHLFMLSRARPWSKTLWIVVATAGTAAHVAAPWVATAGGGGAMAFYGASGVALGLAYVWMSLVPLWEMWAPAPSR